MACSQQSEAKLSEAINRARLLETPEEQDKAIAAAVRLYVPHAVHQAEAAGKGGGRQRRPQPPSQCRITCDGARAPLGARTAPRAFHRREQDTSGKVLTKVDETIAVAVVGANWAPAWTSCVRQPRRPRF